MVPNAVLAKVGSDGNVCVYTLADTDLVVDVNGWYDLPPNEPDNNVTVLNADAATIVTGGPDTGAATIATDHPLPVGSIIVTTMPNGQPYYGRVTAVDGAALATQEVALADVIPVLDVSMDVDTTTGAFTTLTAGNHHTCGLRPDQTVTCWGAMARNGVFP